MRVLKIKAVVLTNGEHYFIHGSDEESSGDMFKAMQPIWAFDPATETAHFIELEVTLPEMENVEELRGRELDWKVEADRADSDAG